MSSDADERGHRGKMRRSWRLLVLALIFAGGLCGGLVFPLAFRKSMDGQQPSAPGKQSYEVSKSFVDDSQSEAAANAEAGDQEVAVPENARWRNTVQTRRMDFIDAFGKPVLDLKVGVAALKSEAKQGRRTWTTGAEGSITVNANVDESYEVTILSPEWCFSVPTGYGLDATPARKTRWTGPGEPLTFRVRALNYVTLQIKYADGAPYTGRITVTGRPLRTLELDVGLGGQITFLPPPDWMSARVRVHARVVGYESSLFDLAIRQESSTETFTLKRGQDNDPAGILCVELGSFRHVRFLDVVISPLSRSGHQRNPPVEEKRISSSDGTYFSPPLSAGKYRVFVQDIQVDRFELTPHDTPALGSTYSQIVDVVAGQITNIRVEPSESCCVRARVLNQDGSPSRLAALFPYRESPMSWASVGSHARSGYYIAGISSFADSEGMVVLYGLGTNESRVTVQAPGCETIHVPVSLVAGGEVDLGTIFMRSAAGSLAVRIELDESVNDTQYVLKLIDPWTSSRILQRTFTGDVIEIEQLEFRWYCVHVESVAGNVLPAARNVELEEANPRKEVVMSLRSKSR